MSTKGDGFLQIRGKRRSVSVRALTEKARRGRFTSADRALVRVGHGTTKVLIGMDDLSEWDEEELRRGRRRDHLGNFSGRDPVVVPKAVHNELVKRSLADAHRLLQENLVPAVTALGLIATDASVDAKDKLTAIKLIMDRVMGTSPQKVEIGGDAKWQIALQGGIMSMKTVEQLQAETTDTTEGDMDNEDEEEPTEP